MLKIIAHMCYTLKSSLEILKTRTIMSIIRLAIELADFILVGKREQ